MSDFILGHTVPLVPPAAVERGQASQIDALCGVVMTITLISAYTSRYDQVIGHSRHVLANANLGFLSLQMFFAITACQLVKEISRHPDWMRYAGDRFLRFIPAVIPAVLIAYAVIISFHVPRLHADIAAVLANLTMVADFVGKPDFDGAFWRLKIEIMFSVGLGLVWFGMGARSAACMVVLGLAVCIVQVQPDPAQQAVLTPAGILTMDGYLPNLVFGAALFFVTERRHRLFWAPVAALAALLIIASNTPVHAVLVLFSYFVIVVAAHGGIPIIAGVTALTALGRVFFAVFLVHQAVGFAVIHALEQRGMTPEIAICVAAAAAILCGVGLHKVAAELRGGLGGFVAR